MEAVLTPNPYGERVSDELYAQASEHYEDKALATLTMAIGQVGFFTPSPSSASPSPAWRPRSSGGSQPAGPGLNAPSPRTVPAYDTAAGSREARLRLPNGPPPSPSSVVRLRGGGSRRRIRLSNAYGTAPLRATGASVGRTASGAAVQPGTLRTLSFDRSPSATVPERSRPPPGRRVRRVHRQRRARLRLLVLPGRRRGLRRASPPEGRRRVRRLHHRRVRSHRRRRRPLPLRHARW
ncbi:hypothetical protein ACFQHO_25700 [Actinomadura yumaensis]|uniref:hypothetical protein n=1 Tax=Actinomadura yumaensis TaxID=111807 RepID=UPI003612D4C9